MKLRTIMGASFAVIALTLASCSNGSSDAVSTATKPAEAEAKPILGTFGIATDYMDTSVDPGDNFYKFVNGGWLANTDIPSCLLYTSPSPRD